MTLHILWNLLLELSTVYVWLCVYCSTFGSIHATHSEHGSYGSFARTGARALKKRPALGQEMILHPFHQQPLALYTVPEQRVGLQVRQELHIHKKNVYEFRHVTTAVNKQLKQTQWDMCAAGVGQCGLWRYHRRAERKLFSHWLRD